MRVIKLLEGAGRALENTLTITHERAVQAYLPYQVPEPN